MDFLYYLTGLIMVFVLPAIIIGLVIFLSKPHLLNKHPRINKPVSRKKIAILGLTSFAVALLSFGTVLAATEPTDVRNARLEQEAAAVKAKQLEQQHARDAEEAQLKEIEASKPVLKTEIKTESIAFNKTEQNDNTIPQGQSRVATQGVDGERTVMYEITYVKGTETSRKEIKNEITKQPITQLTKIGTYVAPVSDGNGYINSQGNYIPSPSSDPTGASAQCVDGTYSYSQNHRGTCSHHGGVARWL